MLDWCKREYNIDLGTAEVASNDMDNRIDEGDGDEVDVGKNRDEVLKKIVQVNAGEDKKCIPEWLHHQRVLRSHGGVHHPDSWPLDSPRALYDRICQLLDLLGSQPELARRLCYIDDNWSIEIFSCQRFRNRSLSQIIAEPMWNIKGFYRCISHSLAKPLLAQSKGSRQARYVPVSCLNALLRIAERRI